MNIDYDKIKHINTIAGMQGMGKTYLAFKLFYRYREKSFFIDRVGAWRNYIKKGLKVFKLKNYTEEAVNRIIQESKIKNVIDISLLKRKQLAKFLDEFSENILRELESDKKEVNLFLDEAGDYLGQEKYLYSEELETLLRIGRNYGIKRAFLITQRLQKVNKNVIALSKNYFIFKLMHNLDLRAIEELYNFSNWLSIRSKIISFKVGEFLFFNDEEYKIIRGVK